MLVVMKVYLVILCISAIVTGIMIANAPVVLDESLPETPGCEPGFSPSDGNETSDPAA
jgi:hypothetical protein